MELTIDWGGLDLGEASTKAITALMRRAVRFQQVTCWKIKLTPQDGGSVLCQVSRDDERKGEESWAFLALPDFSLCREVYGRGDSLGWGVAERIALRDALLPHLKVEVGWSPANIDPFTL